MNEITKKKVTYFLYVVLSVLIIIIVCASVNLHKKSHGTNDTTFLKDGDSLEVIQSKIGKVIQLPTGETPSMAIVTDMQKLKGDPFFANARVGDIVLVYQGAKRAFLFDPLINKVVEVASFANISSNQGVQVATSTTISTSTKK